MLEEIKGDLFDYVGANVDKRIVIPHVVNDKHAWGAGFVVPLGKFYPKAKEQYMKYEPVLGNVQIVACKNHLADENDNRRNIIVSNMCAQTLGGNRPLYYNHLSKCMDKLVKYFSLDNDYEIVCPRFGSALAGGNWEFIRELIVDCWIKKGLTVKVFYL